MFQINEHYLYAHKGQQNYNTDYLEAKNAAMQLYRLAIYFVLDFLMKNGMEFNNNIGRTRMH